MRFMMIFLCMMEDFYMRQSCQRHCFRISSSFEKKKEKWKIKVFVIKKRLFLLFTFCTFKIIYRYKE